MYIPHVPWVKSHVQINVLVFDMTDRHHDPSNFVNLVCSSYQIIQHLARAYQT